MNPGQKYTNRESVTLKECLVSTIFLDRDGVINEHRADYVKSWSEFRFLPGSCEAIAKLTQAGHRIVVCTNQAGIARGIVSVDTVHEIH
jgi:histidinol-phosphate phosphatase family protein